MDIQNNGFHCNIFIHIFHWALLLFLSSWAGSCYIAQAGLLYLAFIIHARKKRILL